LGGIIFFYSLPKQQPAQTFPAIASRDCAPWDGTAFTVTIEIDPGTTLYISIWRSPDIPLPSTFELPDDDGQVGNAYLVPEIDPYTLLRGEVWFQRVGEGMPIEGRFRFTSERGEVYEGGFVAEWESQVMYCG